MVLHMDIQVYINMVFEDLVSILFVSLFVLM